MIKSSIDYLIKDLNTANCLNIRRFSEEESLIELSEISFDFMLKNFVNIGTNDEILNELTGDELAELFDSNDLNVPGEEFVYETLVKWYSMDRKERGPHLKILLSRVKLPLMSAESLTKEIENNRLITNIDCQTLMLEAVTYHLKPEKFLNFHGQNTTPRKSTVSKIKFITVIAPLIALN